MKKSVLVSSAVFVSGALGLASGCALDDAGADAEYVDLDQEIIGGTTDNGDPSIVALFIHDPGATTGNLCSATVISPRKVLTAAHCVDPRVIGANKVFEVVVGTALSGSPRLAVSGTAFDPAWNPNDLQAGHDVGIVTLAEPTTLTPIAFFQGTYDNTLAGQPIRIVGYGNSNHSGTGAGTKRTATTTVAGFNAVTIQIGTTSRQTCNGDSGGPALQTINGVETVVGITSFGQSIPGIFECFGGGFDTRVDFVRPFINANL